jgi:hypothetical protein
MPNVNNMISNNAKILYLDPENPLIETFEPESNLILIPYDGLDMSNCSECVNIINYSLGENSTFTIHLHEGWNLFSIPLMPENTSLDAVLKEIKDKYIAIYTYEFDWEYRVYAYGRTFGCLREIKPEKGYWIKMKENANLTIHGSILKNPQIFLHPGWNLIGYPSLSKKPLNEVVIQVNPLYTAIYTYEEDWVYKVEAYERWFGNLNEMKPGKGYWIKMKNAGIMKF